MKTKNQTNWTSKLKKELMNTVKSSSSASEGIKVFARKNGKSKAAVNSQYYSILKSKANGTLKAAKSTVLGTPIKSIKLLTTGVLIGYDAANANVSMKNGIISIVSK